MITQLAQRCETNRKLNKHKARENLFEKTNPKKNIHTYKVEQKRTYNRRLWLRVIFVCLFVLVFDWLYFCSCCYSFSASSFSCEVFLSEMLTWTCIQYTGTIYIYRVINRAAVHYTWTVFMCWTLPNLYILVTNATLRTIPCLKFNTAPTKAGTPIWPLH